MKDLAGRVAWITGAASGIGRALAVRLAAEKMKLVLVRANVGVSVVCRGFVKPNIATSSVREGRSNKIADAIAQLVAAGKPPEDVAAAIVAAIREPRFYVLTHPEMKPQIEHRM